jgi:hypothetical protein
MEEDDDDDDDDDNARCCDQYGSKHVTPSKLQETQRGRFHIMSTNNIVQSATAHEKARIKNRR